MKLGNALPAPAVDISLLIARLLLGIVLIAHGIQKIAVFTLPGAVEGFAGMGVPLPEVAVGFALISELVGGTLLILGLFTPIAGAMAIATMLGAFVFAHFMLDPLNGGWETVGMIAAVALVLIAVGPGRYSLDHTVGKKLASRQTAAAAA